jgi:hypothetical protein
MRYIVKYRKPGQVEGARLFDIHGKPSQETIQKAAESVAGANAEIVSVTENDGTVPYEKKADAE